MLASCSHEEPFVPADVKISKTELELPHKAIQAQTYITIKSDQPWTTMISSDWVSMSFTSGEANKEYNVLIKATNNENTESREATITVNSGSTHAKIHVKQERGSLTVKPEDIPDYNKIYNPGGSEHISLSSDGNWFFGRSAQSEHFIAFWQPDYGEFGDTTTPSNYPESKYRVDINALLSWCEECYDGYIKTMKFSDEGHSILDVHKINIYITYPPNWADPNAAAYGSGVEDQVGCLWLNATWANDKAIVAHEVGHSFQYIVGCDKIYNKETSNVSSMAFRYDVGQGNGFWEQCAQWMAYMMLPAQTFTAYNFADYCKATYKHQLHEDTRYSNYFIHHYMTDKYGIDAVAEIWKAARAPKDALEVYMAIHDLSVAEFNAQMYEYAAHAATWDFEGLSTSGLNYVNKISYKSAKGDDGYYKVDASCCPEATGFNVIRLQNYNKGNEISIDFVGLPNEPGYNKSGTATDGGWTIGFVALSSDNTTRYYSETAIATSETDYKTSISWTIPADTRRLWAVVSATPVKYISHRWDENNSNDRHWPYKMAVSGATPSNI